MSKPRRKSISKKIREEIWHKYGEKCAYCGCDLEYKDMQIDHIKSFCAAEFDKKITEDNLHGVDNMMPSCRMCNYYKSASGIEGFRRKLKNTLSHTCTDSFQARLAIKYKMIVVQEWDGKFWFEKYNEENEK